MNKPSGKNSYFCKTVVIFCLWLDILPIFFFCRWSLSVPGQVLFLDKLGFFAVNIVFSSSSNKFEGSIESQSDLPVLNGRTRLQ